jgi:hypothetical protein
MTGAFLVIPLFEEGVVFRERVAYKGNHGQPSRRLRRRRIQSTAIQGVIRDGARLVIGDVRRQLTQGLLDIAAFGHVFNSGLGASCTAHRKWRIPANLQAAASYPTPISYGRHEKSNREGQLAGALASLGNAPRHPLHQKLLDALPRDRAPQSPDRAGTRTVSRDEVKFDPALRPIEPFLNHFSMMISGVAGKHVNPPFERIQDLEDHRQRHRAPRVDRQNFDHFCFTGFSIDSAVDIKAIPSAALVNGNFDIFRRPTSNRTRGVRRMNGIGEHDRFIIR